jgi:hypothetical protein
MVGNIEPYLKNVGDGNAMAFDAARKMASAFSGILTKASA